MVFDSSLLQLAHVCLAEFCVVYRLNDTWPHGRWVQNTCLIYSTYISQSANYISRKILNGIIFRRIRNSFIYLIFCCCCENDRIYHMLFTKIALYFMPFPPEIQQWFMGIGHIWLAADLVIAFKYLFVPHSSKQS